MSSDASRIQTDAISVVVQGPVAGVPSAPPRARQTLRALCSVRRHLPGAELILSTWRGSDVSGLPFDRLVESDDPGGMRCDDWPNTRCATPMPYNANRQIVSSQAGLRAATRPFAMKLRSDMALTGRGFLRYIGRYPERAADWRVLGERVIVPNWWSRNPRATHGMPHHPSDWFQFGRLQDVRALWEVPLIDAELPMWYASRPRPAAYRDTHLHYRYTVEQYTWLAFLRQHGEVPLDHRYDATPSTIALTELTIANNLVVADLAALDVRFLKYRASVADWGTLYTHGEWQQLYRAYCDPAFVPALDVTTPRKRAYNALVAPVHTVLRSPRSSPVGRDLSAAWEERYPRSFHALKRAYLSGWSVLGRAPWRRA